ncbi:hypothetical protein [Verminephrobacter aporrectodeae]|uniref:hypothetical protein n=1 Tax=Verminephrobacter aporrectodeae TaxID=1110389 RepID=UPI002238FA62|nr:hypothetical protein [Verminephrobacter aporrectodeae]
MKFSPLSVRLLPALIVACALCACSDSGGDVAAGSPSTPQQPDTGVAPVKSCAP